MATKTPVAIRDLREQKNLSQDAVAEACGLTYSTFVRIEAGGGKTTPEEVKHVLSVLKEMEPGTRKLGGGRPFKDPEMRARVRAARETGTSVAAAIAGEAPPPPPAKKATRKKAAPKKDLASALSKKPRKRTK